MESYKFNPDKIYSSLLIQWKYWAQQTGSTKFVLGISGGKDSTILAKIGADCFGPENIYGVMMPNGDQKDLDDAKRVFEVTGINRHFVNIKTIYEDLYNRVSTSGSKPMALSGSTSINIGPRIRMTVLYALAQTVGGIVLNTDNLSEIMLGYYTIFGDGAGTYGPLRNLTASEVIALGDYLALPSELVHKVPGDGLQGQTDEDRFGFTYAQLDAFIRSGRADPEVKEKIMKRYCANKFKTELLNIPGPVFPGLENRVKFLDTTK